MNRLIDQYKQGIGKVLHHHNYVFLDNVYPNPIREIYRADKQEIPVIEASTSLVDFWKKTLEKEERIFIPWKIYIQSMRGYGALTKVIRRRRKEGISPGLEEAVERYIPKLFSLLEESRRHIFRYSAGESGEYHVYAGIIKMMVEEYLLKKENHEDDSSADETLVASAVYKAGREDASCAIVTNDHDIGRILRKYRETDPRKLVLPADVSIHYPPRVE